MIRKRNSQSCLQEIAILTLIFKISRLLCFLWNVNEYLIQTYVYVESRYIHKWDDISISYEWNNNIICIILVHCHGNHTILMFGFMRIIFSQKYLKI